MSEGVLNLPRSKIFLPSGFKLLTVCLCILELSDQRTRVDVGNETGIKPDL